MTIEAHDLVDVTEIAHRLNVQPATVHQWRQRFDSFPPPLRQFAIGPIWTWQMIQLWAIETGRL